VAVGLFMHKINILKENNAVSLQIQRLYPSQKNLVDPLLLVESPQDGDVKLRGTKYAIEAYINQCKERGDASSVSVYLRHLNYGTWIGINEDENYAAASLIKVPLMIAYLRMAEKNPLVLKKEIKYDKEINIQLQQT